MPDGIFALLQQQPVYLNVYIAILRWVAPALALILLARCGIPLLTFRKQPEIWAFIHLSDDRKIPVTHWENIIGRNKNCDIVVDFPTVSNTHCVLTRYDDGSWSIADTDSKDGVRVNGKKVAIRALQPQDVISIGGVEMTVQPITRQQGKRIAESRKKRFSILSNFGNVLLLSAFQLLTCLAFLLRGQAETAMSVVAGFGGIMIAQWALMLLYVFMRRNSFEIETVAFFLTTLGMAMIASVRPSQAVKQLISIIIGLAGFLFIGWSLRDLNRAKKIRLVAAVAGVGFLLITLLFGKEYNGAKNWLSIGSFSLQPSELSKVCFVFVGASAMDRIVTKRNLILFIAYSVLICGLLAVMNDFGAALIFFCAFLVIAYLRSGNVGTLALAITALAIAGVLLLRMAPHALKRFASWRHIWEDPANNNGLQQVRALICMASGGLLGLGAGQGWMKRVFAADSDVVIATLAEEWGLIMLVVAILNVVVLAAFCLRSARFGRSSFYTIGACTAISIILVQVILNALGTVDILPLTGVTFPFLSNGGSSMICSWCLLAFIKAADTRQNASFAVKLSKPKEDGEDE